MALANSYTVSGAGTAAVNGTYTIITGANGTFNGANQYTNGTYFLAFLTGGPNWAIQTGVNSNAIPQYSGATGATATNLPLTGWTSVQGTAPAPTFAAVAGATSLAPSYIVSSAGIAAINGNYLPVTGANATFNGATQFNYGGFFLYYTTANTQWNIAPTPNGGGSPYYVVTTTGPTVMPLTGWGGTGTAPFPTLSNGGATGTNSAPSNLATATPNAAPNAPTLLTATAGNTLVTLNWTNPASLAAIVVQRRIYVAPGGTLNAFVNLVTLPAATAGSPATVPVSYNDTAVTNGTTYEYQVYATP